MSDEVMTEEEQEAWYAAKAERKLAHLNSLDQATKDLAAACHRRVSAATLADRHLKALGVPEDEYDAWSEFLMPWERFMNVELANRGQENTLCKGIAIFPVVRDE